VWGQGRSFCLSWLGMEWGDYGGRRPLRAGPTRCPVQLEECSPAVSLSEICTVMGSPSYRLPWQGLLSCEILAIPAAAGPLADMLCEIRCGGGEGVGGSLCRPGGVGVGWVGSLARPP
jgi:hypothetical protein